MSTGQEWFDMGGIPNIVKHNQDIAVDEYLAVP
jgi:hypothetical protein